MNNYNFDFSTSFGVIELECQGNYNLVIKCFNKSKRFDFNFEYFHGLTNTEEFFDPNDSTLYKFNKLKDSNCNFPVSWALYKEFYETLSEYQKITCSDNTKLWIFLSMSNIVTVYSDDEPILEKKTCL